MVLGEWYRDTRLGFPWFERVLIKSPSLVLIRSLFRQTILSVPGVVAIETLSETYDRATRTLRPSFRARMDDGTILDDAAVFGSLQPLEVR